MPGFTASLTLHPGDVIHKEKPYMKVLCRKFKDKACASCLERTKNLKFCMQCLTVKYCGKKCQTTDWEEHRLECKKLKNLEGADLEKVDNIRLLGNIILKIKGQDWKTIKTTILGTDGSFDDIDPHLEEISMNDPKILHYKDIKEYVSTYIGDENMPDEEDFIKIFGKVSFNTLMGTTKSGCTVLSFSIGISLIDTECIPNCNITSMAYAPTIWAMKKINEFEKITVSYQNILHTSPFFLSLYSKPCKCTECRLPYGESLLSRCIDEKQAFALISLTKQFLMMWDTFSLLRDMPVVQLIADDLLKKQENILGNTNVLHLRLLAIKCFQIGGEPLETKRDLMKLEMNMVAVYGEYFVRLVEIYEALADVCFRLGEMGEGHKYLRKKIALDTYADMAMKKA